jgi:hypothetical protein
MVTDEQLLTDIDNTVLEFGAYEKLDSAYTILSELPENKGMTSSLLYAQALQNRSKAVECKELLDKLMKLKEQRSIK